MDHADNPFLERGAILSLSRRRTSYSVLSCIKRCVIVSNFDFLGVNDDIMEQEHKINCHVLQVIQNRHRYSAFFLPHHEQISKILYMEHRQDGIQVCFFSVSIDSNLPNSALTKIKLDFPLFPALFLAGWPRSTGHQRPQAASHG